MPVKKIRVNHVPAGALEGLALLVSARSLNSAVRKLRNWKHFDLPDGVYYVFEAGRYEEGHMLTIQNGGCHTGKKAS